MLLIDFYVHSIHNDVCFSIIRKIKPSSMAKLGKQFTRGKVENINEAEKTFDVVFATENPVFRRGWEESYNEILSCVATDIRTARLDEGVVPLLDNHNRYEGVAKQYGIIESWKIENGECKATMRFSTRSEFDGIWSDIKAKVIKSISVGYNVYKYVREMVGDGQTPNYRATDWEPLEISLAPVPADFKSSIRADESELHDVEIINPLIQNRNTDMLKNDQSGTTQTAPVTTENRAGESTTTPVVTVDTAAVRSEAIQAERQRSKDIETACQKAGLGSDFARGLIEDGSTIEAARAAIIDKLAEANKTPTVRSTTNVTIGGNDEADQIREAMAQAILHRAEPGSVKLNERAQDMRGMKLVDMARYSLERKGERPYSYSTNEMVKRAISTTDYPDILSTTVARQLRKYFEAAPSNWKPLGTQTSVSDFRAKTGVQVDGKVTFEKIAEGGEYKQSKIQSSKAQISVDTFGKLIKITRQSIINDDLDVFSRIPKLFAVGAANLQTDMFWAMITGNVKTPDGQSLFHADHANLGAGALMSEDSLNAAIVAMGLQRSPAGEELGLTPKYLIVPLEQLMLAKKLMTSVSAIKTGDVNVFNGSFEIIPDARLSRKSSKSWYLAADPSSVEGLMYAYLDGEEGLYTENRVNFEDDSVETKARMEFGVAAWDYRGWYKNAGL